MVDLTFDDKDREITLDHTFTWVPMEFKLDGVLTNKLVVPDGTYLIENQFNGRIPDFKELTALWIRVHRYPWANHTAYYQIILFRKGFWVDTRGGIKIVVNKNSTDDRIARSVGIDYRLDNSQPTLLIDRVIKFIPV